MGPCAASVETDGALIARISGGGETLSVIPISNATNLNGVGAGMVGWQQVGTDTAETSSTTTVINATTHAARVGDALIFTGGTAGNQQVWSVVSAVTANTITLANALPATPANGDAFNILRPVTIGAGPAGSSNAPSLNVNIDANTQLSTATGILKQEDVAPASGDAGVAILNQRLDQLATGQTGSNNEYALPIVDTLSRLYVNPWGSAVTEFSSSCGTATASTADVAIKAAVASNRIYVGAITCASSDADNATNINFKDGTTVVAVGGVNQMATTSAGTFTATFNPPLRGTSNTAFNFNTAVSTSSVICCASTFTSPY